MGNDTDLGAVINFATSNFATWGILILLAVLLWAGTKVGHAIREHIIWPKIDKSRRDPVRLFDRATSQGYYRAAGNRCEGSKLGVLRCRETAGNADHWFPHARGGRTTGSNLVALCPTCNKRKSAKLPSVFQTKLVAHRRRSYWPAGSDTSINGKSGHAGLLAQSMGNARQHRELYTSTEAPSPKANKYGRRTRTY